MYGIFFITFLTFLIIEFSIYFRVPSNEEVLFIYGQIINCGINPKNISIIKGQKNNIFTIDQPKVK